MRLRWLLCGIVLVGMAGEACAADFPDFLRGSQTVMSAPQRGGWGGAYFGAQASYSMASTDFGQGVGSLVSFALRNTVIQDQVSGWTTLPKQDTTGGGFGGFIGYNWQWDQIVLGVEGNYSRTNLFMSASDSLSRSILNNSGAPAGHDFTYNMTVSADAAVKLTDVATFRARAGYDAGMFMPYGFVGPAFGRADITRSATVSGTLTDNFTTTQVVGFDSNGNPITVQVPTSTTSRLILPGQQLQAKNTYLYGWTGGLGLDMCLMANLFVRAEWEWVQFAPVDGVNLHTSTVRAAVAVKF
jgi:outer membrane immunogenic protein